MKDAGSVLHMAAHTVVEQPDDTMLSSAIDVEMHRGKDGRLYLLDLARSDDKRKQKKITLFDFNSILTLVLVLFLLLFLLFLLLLLLLLAFAEIISFLA